MTVEQSEEKEREKREKKTERSPSLVLPL